MIRLLVADTHFTAKPQDEYRWGLFGWIKAWIERYGVDQVWILGDLTDAKEGHNAEFVNRLTGELSDLAEIVDTFILRGNHDFRVEHVAFFEFLDKIPGITWIDEVTEFGDVLAVPYSKNPDQDWPFTLEYLDTFNYVFFHQCFVGSRSSLGYILDGTDLNLTGLTNAKAYAGDIHMPQTVGGIEYVGSPYQTTYGDRFMGRCLLETPNGRETLHYPTIQRCTVEISSVAELMESRLYPGDQVKVRFYLPAERRAAWGNLKEQIRVAAKEMGLELAAIELNCTGLEEAIATEARDIVQKRPQSAILNEYADKEGLGSDYRAWALQVLEDEL